MKAFLVAIAVLFAAAQAVWAYPSTSSQNPTVASVVTTVQSKAKRSSAACQGCISGPIGMWCPMECCKERCGTRKRANTAQCYCDCQAGLWDSASKTCF